MKVKRQIKCPYDTVSSFIQKLADDDAGVPAYSGFQYEKKIQGMNGKTAVVTVEIASLEPGAYSVAFIQPDSRVDMSYTYQPISDEVTELVYEEKTSSTKAIKSIDQKLSGFLYGMATKKVANRRLDAFEKALEAYKCQD